MKKFKLAVGCLLLFVLGSSFARADDGTSTGLHPRLGVEGGFNLANLNGPNVNDVFASRLGFVGGGFLILPFSSGAGIQAELLYAQKGGKINGSPYSLDYVEIPILLNVKILGPVGILLGPAFNATVVDSGLSNINRADVGVVMGVQLLMNKFVLNGRYEIGLLDVDSTQTAQNGTFTFMAGFSFI